jgi:16S rRNA (cytosine967-C5)-methyltransferase
VSTSPDPRRQAALILARVEGRDAFAGRLLAGATGAVREMVLQVLRWQRTLDWLLEPCLARGLGALDLEVRVLLRLGLYEARRMSAPAPVAVAEAVRLAKSLAPRASGLVNAVLRRALAAPWPSPGDEGLPLGVRLSHPDWLVTRWQRLLGEELARRALEANQTPAPLCLLRQASDGAALEAAGCRLQAHPFADGVAVVAEGATVAAKALVEGRAYAMDPSAAVVARLLPAAPGPAADLAAAPGGKSLLLALERGGWAVAADRHPGRALLMRDNLRSVKALRPVVVADAGRAPLRPGAFGAVLLDAPCSGTGTLRRHPEIRWRLREEDLGALARLQRELLAGAASLLRPGGVLLYATCSLEPEENADVVGHASLEAVPLEGHLPPGVPRVALPSDGVVIPPGPEGDGFTAHLLRRPA